MENEKIYKLVLTCQGGEVEYYCNKTLLNSLFNSENKEIKCSSKGTNVLKVWESIKEIIEYLPTAKGNIIHELCLLWGNIENPSINDIGIIEESITNEIDSESFFRGKLHLENYIFRLSEILKGIEDHNEYLYSKERIGCAFFKEYDKLEVFE